MTRLLACALVVLAAAPSPLAAWGFVAHRIVAENAAAAMPGPVSRFFTSGVKAISGASIEPDSRLKARLGEEEKRRHYLDLEDLDLKAGSEIPADPAQARALFGSLTLERAGLLPWRIGEVYADLTRALREKKWKEALRLSGWLSHYVADACQPLHTTSNHDGQKTGAHGIHAAFETDLIDLSRAAYRARTAPPSGFRPETIADPTARMIREIQAAHQQVGALLKADREAMQSVRRTRADYWKELERRAGPLAVKQLSLAVRLTASLWHSAWIEAGRPSLPERAPPIRGD